jgi:hypothetical protein
VASVIAVGSVASVACLALSASVASAAINGEYAYATCNQFNHSIQMSVEVTGDFNGQWVLARTVVAFPGGAWQTVAGGQWTERQVNPYSVTNGAEYGTNGITVSSNQLLYTQQLNTGSGGQRLVGVQYESWNGQQWVYQGTIYAQYLQTQSSNPYLLSPYQSGTCMT